MLESSPFLLPPKPILPVGSSVYIKLGTGIFNVMCVALVYEKQEFLQYSTESQKGVSILGSIFFIFIF